MSNMSNSDFMWQCHGCFTEYNYHLYASCINCGHVRCEHCYVYRNPVKDAPKSEATQMWTCCICYNDNRASAGGVCWSCSHYRDRYCTQSVAYPQD